MTTNPAKKNSVKIPKSQTLRYNDTVLNTVSKIPNRD